MTALSNTVVKRFCEICNSAYEFWITHRTLFDSNPQVEKLVKGDCGAFFSRLSIITQEYALHQLVKLHDPAVQGNSINLTIEYIIDYGDWDQETFDTLKDLQSRMESLAKRIKPARNKLLSHNDLKTIIKNSTLGDFEEGADSKYFNLLQKFVNLVHDKCIGGPYPFKDLAIKDADILLSKIIDNETT